MSSPDTARRVVEWAATGDGPPPRAAGLADYRDPDRLARPPADARDALARLAGVTAARLRLPAPPLGDARPVGAGALVMALAVAARESPELARYLLVAVPPAETTAEWVVRHGLLAAALPHLPDAWADEWRLLSPLTALLDRPPGGAGAWRDADARRAADRLRDHPDGRRLLVDHLARPTTVTAVRAWRADLLDRLRPHDPDLVLDVYEAAMIHHEAETLGQVRAARRVLAGGALRATADALEAAAAQAEWWGPLWAVERQDLNAVRARRYLGYDYREGIALFVLARRRPGGGA